MSVTAMISRYAFSLAASLAFCAPALADEQQPTLHQFAHEDCSAETTMLRDYHCRLVQHHFNALIKQAAAYLWSLGHPSTYTASFMRTCALAVEVTKDECRDMALAEIKYVTENAYDALRSYGWPAWRLTKLLDLTADPARPPAAVRDQGKEGATTTPSPDGVTSDNEHYRLNEAPCGPDTYPCQW